MRYEEALQFLLLFLLLQLLYLHLEELDGLLGVDFFGLPLDEFGFEQSSFLLELFPFFVELSLHLLKRLPVIVNFVIEIAQAQLLLEFDLLVGLTLLRFFCDDYLHVSIGLVPRINHILVPNILPY